MFLLILSKHEYYFHSSKIKEFVRLIHAKSIGLWWGPNMWDIFFKNNLSEVHNWHWWFPDLFYDTCDIFCIHYCALTGFHDSALLLATKLQSHFHFVYSPCMTCFHCMTIPWYPLISLLIATLASPLLVETSLEGCYGLSPYLPDK